MADILTEYMPKLQAIDALFWAESIGLSLGSVKFSLSGHEYQEMVFTEDAPVQCKKKGAQMGFSQVEVIKTLHGLIYGRYPQGALYLFPTRDDVTDFSKGRFGPLISDNPMVGRFVQDTDAANVKRIGKSMLYLRGARSSQRVEGVKKSSSQLKSVPVDRIVFDEVDEMEPEMVTLALERVSHSMVREVSYLSTPTIPDFGIDALYNKSDQRVWMVKCEGCGVEMCLELEFPECLAERPDGSVFRRCRKCGREVHPSNGSWVAQYPSRSKDLVGWWISQLNSTFVDPKVILNLWRDPPNGRLAEVYNSKLGMAYIEAENRLSPNDVWEILGREPMMGKHPGPCAMGVDRGRDLHITIVDRPRDGTLRVVKACTRSVFANDSDRAKGLSSLEPLHDLVKQYNVKTVVLDNKPEPGKVRDFRDAESGIEVFGCEYLEHGRGVVNWDSKAGVVRTNRTEVCDATHDLVVTPGKLELPRRSVEIEEFGKHLCNIARVMEEDSETGSREMRYKKLGPDHYRHSLNYAYLAAKRIGIFHGTEKDRRKLRDGYDVEESHSRSWMAS